MAKRGYIAAILDLNFAEDLINATEGEHHNHIVCKQVTLAYNPSDEVFKKYEHLIGKEIDLLVYRMVWDAYGQAVLVHGVETENGHAHITISHAECVRASYSNDLIVNPDRNEIPLGMAGKATVRFVQHQGTK